MGLAFGGFRFYQKCFYFLVLCLKHMARPTKYTPELTKRVRQYLTDGLTVRDCCYGVGISEDTFCRWRREKPEFAKLVQEATEAQCWSSLGLALTSEYRRYQRQIKRPQTQPESSKWPDTHLDTEKPLEQALNGSQSRFVRGGIVSPVNSDFAVGFKTKTSPPTNDFGELVCCEPYYNSATSKVEWVEKETYGKPVLHRCSLEKWEEIAKARLMR